jgi:hypothetical protein
MAAVASLRVRPLPTSAREGLAYVQKTRGELLLCLSLNISKETLNGLVRGDMFDDSLILKVEAWLKERLEL